MRSIETAAGLPIPILGQGTYGMGERPGCQRAEVDALRLGIDLGLGLIDTAEMYADGGAERIVGEAIAGRRDQVVLVSKVLPRHADFEGTIAACESSLSRLRVEQLDLYLLHWASEYPLEETLRAFTELRERGLIRYWGVSNFDASQMAAARRLTGGVEICCNQVLYNLSRRWCEWSLIPRCRRVGVAVQAYTPIERGRLEHPALHMIARKHDCEAMTVALAWTICSNAVCSVVKATRLDHVRANASALELDLDDEDLSLLDRAFPPPTTETPLQTL